jgi:predicted nuclease with TOPRIM domain
VSNPGGNGASRERQPFDELERAIGDMLDRLTWMNDRMSLAEEKSEELEELLRRFTGHEVEPGDMVSKLRKLEEENSDLRARVDQGREGVERLLAKIRFLENQQP